MSDKQIIAINKNFKHILVRRRKDFMDLLLKALADDTKASEELNTEFGVKFVTKVEPGNSLTILVDGQVEYRL